MDVGCNLGVYAYELGRLTGNVVAFEPNPTLANLVAGLALAGVRVEQVALSSEEGTAELMVPVARGGHGLASLNPQAVAGRETERVSVPTRRLDGYAFSNVRFMKIDVEGFEEQVLAGAAVTIARDRPTLLIEIEERHNAGGLDRIRALLAPLGYEGWFFLDDRKLSLDRFDARLHQRQIEELEQMGRTADRRSIAYINNFLFTAPAVGGARKD